MISCRETGIFMLKTLKLNNLYLSFLYCNTIAFDSFLKRKLIKNHKKKLPLNTPLSITPRVPSLIPYTPYTPSLMLIKSFNPLSGANCS